ncbi:MAG: hypothetical protein JXR94_03515 [Candidatus Hydrogenedentes bacterium]|nr:hypothetical protein [Candidatus Hydrogenedentota bacterium]
MSESVLLRLAGAACAALICAASAGAGTFVDRDGIRHRWHITDAHVLVWDSAPYLPFGGMYVPRAFFQDGDAILAEDKARLAVVRQNGVEDVYLNPCRAVPPERLQQMIDILEELGFHYGLQLCLPPSGRMPGYRIQPGHLEHTMEEPGRCTLEAGDLARGRYIVCSVRNGEVLASGQVEARDGQFTISFDGPCPGGALVKIVPETDSSWSTDGDARAIADYIRPLLLGPGFRFFIDPIGNEYCAPRFFLPRGEAWRTGFARFLEQRYPNLRGLAQAWGLRKSDLSGFDQAARLVPMIAGSSGSNWPAAGYVMDDASGEVLRADMKRSRMWADMCEARELDIRDWLNALCDVIKAIHDVPVIAKRHHESTRIWSNPNSLGGLDGLGMESYIKGDRLASFNGAATYADIVQSKRPMWCLVTEYNGATWTDRHITYQNRAEMYSDIQLLLRLGAKGVFMFGLGLSASGGDRNWTIYELLNDPRQIEWLGTFGAIARTRSDWLEYRPSTAFWYPPQNTDAKAFTHGDLPDYGLSGSWTGSGSVLKLGPGRWVAPTYVTDVPGPIVYSSDLAKWPCLGSEAAAAQSLPKARRFPASADGALGLPPELSEAVPDIDLPLQVSVWTPADGVEGIEWRDGNGTPHISLRATRNAVSVRLTSDSVGEVSARLPGDAAYSPTPLPMTAVLPGAMLRTQSFVLHNPGFGADNVEFECEVGEAVHCVHITGAARDEIGISSSLQKR